MFRSKNSNFLNNRDNFLMEFQQNDYSFSVLNGFFGLNFFFKFSKLKIINVFKFLFVKKYIKLDWRKKYRTVFRRRLKCKQNTSNLRKRYLKSEKKYLKLKKKVKRLLKINAKSEVRKLNLKKYAYKFKKSILAHKKSYFNLRKNIFKQKKLKKIIFKQKKLKIKKKFNFSILK